MDVLGDVEAELPEGLDEGFDGVVFAGIVRGEQQEVDVGGGEEFAAAVTADGVETDLRVGDGTLVVVADDAVDLRGVVLDKAVHVVVAPSNVRGEGVAQFAQVVAGARGFCG